MSNSPLFEFQKQIEILTNTNHDNDEEDSIDDDIIILEEESNFNKSFLKSTPIKKEYFLKKSTSQKNLTHSSKNQQNSDYGSFTNFENNSIHDKQIENNEDETSSDDLFNEDNDDSINSDYFRNSFKRKKNLSSNSSNSSFQASLKSNQSDCIILEEINAYDSFIILLRKSLNMEVFALKDKSKHIWQRAILIEINEEEEKYQVKFKQSFQKDKHIVYEYENDTESDEDLSSKEKKYLNATTSEILKTFKLKNNKKSLVCSYHNILEKEDYEEVVELDSRSVAYAQLGCVELNETTIKIKSRVVSYCNLEIQTRDQKQTLLNTNYLCSGTIGELPCKKNNNRYLIFFDNGYVSYAKRNHIYYIFDYFSMPVERVSFDHIYFLKSYFETYPSRSMVQLEPNDIITVYLNNKWHDCRIVEVEASLVKLDLNTKMLKMKHNLSNKISHTIWFYRGSPKFLPIYEMITNKITNYDVETQMPTPYEKYLIDKRKKGIDDSKRDISIRFHCFSSTLFPSKVPEIKEDRLDLNLPISIAKQVEMKFKDEKLDGELVDLNLNEKISNLNLEFMPHECTCECVSNWENLNELKGAINPLLKPILSGWQRQVFTQPKSKTNPSKKWINYMAPCGKTLRSTGEVDRYLYQTNSLLTIDMFSFDHYVQITREFSANAKYLSIEDICDGKETIPISCVNGVDNEKPEHFVYTPIRSAMTGVPLLTESSELEGCNCEDNCRDRSKCKCWRKTFELTTYSPGQELNTNVGYRGRRLPQLVNTGIFECNNNCKCDHRCSNRVVQNGISLRIQLFKTPNKGWGVRCLDDIPKGAFISCYSGQIMNEEQSYERNQEYGDTYFAELDFIECIRRLKEGYVEEPNTSINTNDSDLETNHSKSVLPKKSLHKVNTQPEIEYICINSDEDDQEREFKSPDKNNLSESQQLIKDKKDKELELAINSNRFFKDKNDKIFNEYIQNEQLYIIDGSVCGNIARFFNHSCSPNVFVQNVFIDTYDFRFPWIAFFAMNFIRAGTELCWNYGYVIDSVKGKRLNCYCNTSRCRGRLL